MKKVRLALAIVMLLGVLFSAATAAEEPSKHTVTVKHIFLDANYQEVHTETTSFEAAVGEEFYINSLAPAAAPDSTGNHWFKHEVAGFSSEGAWIQASASAAGGTDEKSYADGDADGKTLIYSGRYIGLDFDGYFEFRYIYVQPFTRLFVDGEGNAVPGVSAPVLYLKNGQRLTVAVPEIEGYKLRTRTKENTILSWNQSVSRYTGTYQMGSDPITTTFVYDKYRTVTYTDGVDGEEVFADQTFTDLIDGDFTPIFSGYPKRTGYNFTGWSPAMSDTVSGDATYTATWEKKTHKMTVTYIFRDSKGNEVNKETSTFDMAYGEEFYINSLAPETATDADGIHRFKYTVPGYSSTGWWYPIMQSSAGGSGAASYINDADGKTLLYKNRFVTLDADGYFTFYYMYQNTLTRSYVDGEGNPIAGYPANVHYLSEGQGGSVKVPEIEGYKLRQTTREGAPVTWNDPNNCFLFGRFEITKTGDSIVATFVYDKYRTVTYTDGVEDAEIFPDQITENLIDGDEVPAFDGTPSRSGYTFEGWFTDEACTQAFDPAAPLQGDTVLYAKWEPLLPVAGGHLTLWLALTAVSGLATAGAALVLRRKETNY